MASADDFLVVVVTSSRVQDERLRLARKWLVSVPHVVYSDRPLEAAPNRSKLRVRVLSSGEDDDKTRGKDWHGHTAGDSRAALALHEANASFFGTFKWLVPCDDDSMLFVDALRMRP